VVSETTILEPHEIHYDHYTRFRKQIGETMDPQMKQIFDELKTVTTSISDLKESLSQHIDGVEKTLGDRFHN